MPDRLLIGTRASRLALVQTELVAARLKDAWPGLEVRIEPIRTSGDWGGKDTGTRNAEPGTRSAERETRNVKETTPGVFSARAAGVGWFVRELEQALLAGRVDLAVHSMKDVPTRLPDGLDVEAAVPERADVRDCLVAPAGLRLSGASPGAPGLEALPAAARVGTGSPRRRAMLRAARPDLVMVDLRGNVETRLAKLAAGQCEAAVLALAGLARLGLAGGALELGTRRTEWVGGPGSGVVPPDPIPQTQAVDVVSLRFRVPRSAFRVPLDPSVLLPAAGQGALGLEFRAADERVRRLLGPLDHPPARAAVTAERALVRRLGAGCHTPLGAWGRADPAGRLVLEAWLLAPEGSPWVRRRAEGSAADAAALGAGLAEEVLAAGGAALLKDGIFDF